MSNDILKIRILAIKNDLKKLFGPVNAIHFQNSFSVNYPHRRLKKMFRYVDIYITP